MKKLFFSFFFVVACAINAQVITLIDSNTKENVNFEKIASLPTGAVLDNILYAKKDGQFYKRIFEGGINPKWYGAKGDGVSNDTQAFQKMINSLVSGSFVFIPAGNFLVDGLTIQFKENLIFDGVGTVVRSGSGQGNLWTIQYDKNIEFRNFKMDAKPNTNTKGAYQLNGVLLVKSDNCRFLNLEIKNQANGGVVATDSSDFTVDKCRFYGNKGAADIGFGFATAEKDLNNAIITNNICHSNNFFGVDAEGYGENVLIAGNNISNKTMYGINVYTMNAKPGQKWVNVQVVDNKVQNVSDISPNKNPATNTYFGMGIYLQTIDKLTVRGNIVLDVLKNRTEQPFNRGNPPGGIALTDCTTFLVDGNIIKNSGVDGIAISAYQNTNYNMSAVQNNIVENVSGYGIVNYNVGNINYSGNSVTNSKLSGYQLINNGQLTVMKNILFTNNIFNNSVGSEVIGYEIYSSVADIIQNVNFINNTAIDSKMFSFNFSKINSLYFVGNKIVSEKYKAISAYHSLIFTNVQNLNLSDNIWIADTNKYDKSAYFNNVSKAILNNNIIKANAAFEVESNSTGIVNTGNILN